MSDSLEEYGEVEAQPVETEIDTIIVSRLAVTDDFTVTRIIYGILARGDLLVAVKVDELEVTCTQSFLGTCGSIDKAVHRSLVHIIIGCFLVCREESRYSVTPDFAVTHKTLKGSCQGCRTW